MFYYDSLTLSLAALLFCLFCGDVSVRFAVWHVVRRRTFKWPLGYGIETALTLVLALLALMVRHIDLVVVLLAAMMIVLGGRTGNIFLPSWGIPALILYGIFPSTLGVILLLPVFFWPGQKPESMYNQRCIGAILATGLAVHAVPFQSGMWLVGAGSVITALSAWGYLRRWRVLSGIALILRPLLLLGVMYAAQAEGLTESAQAAAIALLLDLVLYVVHVLRPSWRLLTLSLPPLPGFVVIWFGMHATLGLATGGAGWTMSGIIITIILALLSALDVLYSLSDLKPLKITFSFIIAAALIPSFVIFLARGVISPATHSLLDYLDSNDVWFFQGGDGAIIAFPILWGVLIFWWLVIVRPWSLTMPIMFPASQPIIVSEQKKWLEWSTGNTPRFPWLWRRYIVLLFWHSRDIKKRLCLLPVPLSEIGLPVWLVLLGAVLAVLGLSS